MSWKFQKGRLSLFTGGKNVNVIRDRWKISKGEKDQASWLAIGLNSRAEGGYLHNGLVRGSVTLGLGDNRGMDGKIESDFGAQCTLLEANVKLDGKLILKNGKFVG
jgi:hypothetical protein